MKKVIVCLCVYLIAAFSFKTVSADGTSSLNDEMKIESYIYDVYQHIDFSKSNRLPYEAFNKAYHGYLNLREAGKLDLSKQLITICDFDLASTENRLWIIDLAAKKVLFNTYVAHGQGSGEEFASSFSNEANTHKSSLGFYVTRDTYTGEHGTSLHLEGMDEGFNDAALDRGIVVHGAKYVSDNFINSKDMLGRSWGCPAVPDRLSLPIINAIKEGTCLFIYYPEAKYMKTAYWLNKKISHLPEDAICGDFMKQEMAKPKTRIAEFIHNGKVDSVKTVQLTQ